MIILKEVPSVPYHLVDTQGNVYVNVGNGLAVRPTHTNKGYRRTNINNQSRTVHRLVLETFWGPPAKGQESRHLDGMRENNYLFNLAWGTAKENTADKLRHGTHSVQVKGLLSDDQVKYILSTDRPIDELADELQVSHKVVGSVRRGRTYLHIDRSQFNVKYRKNKKQGQANGRAIVTADMVQEIRESKESSIALSKRMPICHGTIRQIRNRKIWKHIP